MNGFPGRMVVNATPLLNNLTGVGQVAFEISRRLIAGPGGQIDFFTPFKTFPSLAPVLKNDYRFQLLKLAKRAARRLPFKEKIRCCADRGRKGLYDLYWEPNYIPLDSIAAKYTVATAYDMSVFDHPEWHPKDRVVWFEKNFFENLKRSDRIVTISDFSKQRLLTRHTDLREDRVVVIPCGINPDVFYARDPEEIRTFRIRHRLPERFILFVGTMEPRKNMIHLLSAYERLPEAFREECPLVLAGDAGWENRDILERIEPLRRNIRQFGYLKRQEDLALLYNAASVFVFPSLYEGFGIPPLEAMACGTAVCLSSIPVFHEVYGTENICYADPFNSESLTHALKRILDDPAYRGGLIRRGFELSQRYTWDAAFEPYQRLFDELVCSS